MKKEMSKDKQLKEESVSMGDISNWIQDKYDIPDSRMAKLNYSANEVCEFIDEYLKSLPSAEEESKWISKEKLPTVVFEFNGMPDFVCEKEYYTESGGANGILKMLNVSRKELKKVHYKLMSPSEYPKDAWEG